MSVRADKRSARFMAEAHAHYDTPPKIYIPAAVIFRSRVTRDRPNPRGTRVVSKIERRAVPFATSPAERRKRR